MKRFKLSEPNDYLEITQNYEDLSHRAAQLFTDTLHFTLKSSPVFSVVLSGSQTPKRLYELLGQNGYQDKIPWNQVHFFWGDERDFPPDHPASNFRVACESLLEPLHIPEGNIHRIKPDLGSASAAAEDYEQEIRNFISKYYPHQEFRFDLAFMGLGDDGHTASLFPNNPIPTQSDHYVFAPWVSHLDSFRISLTPFAFSYCKRMIFLVSGDGKSSILKKVLQENNKTQPYPAKVVHPKNGEVLWLVDEAAASQLSLDAATLQAA